MYGFVKALTSPHRLTSPPALHRVRVRGLSPLRDTASLRRGIPSRLPGALHAPYVIRTANSNLARLLLFRLRCRRPRRALVEWFHGEVTTTVYLVTRPSSSRTCQQPIRAHLSGPGPTQLSSRSGPLQPPTADTPSCTSACPTRAVSDHSAVAGDAQCSGRGRCSISACRGIGAGGRRA